jgi:hypothetical protein
LPPEEEFRARFLRPSSAPEALSLAGPRRRPGWNRRIFGSFSWLGDLGGESLNG